MFVLETDEFGEEFVRFSPGTNKNWKIDVVRCSAESLRKPVHCFDLDVVNTYKLLISHWPKFEASEVVHPMFLTPRQRVKFFDPLWFLKGPVGRNTLSSMTKGMCENILILKDKRITNKTGRAVGITRMEEAMVPREKGMSVTGHRDAKSYGKYSKEQTEISSKAMQRLISGEGTSYEEVLADEISRRQILKDLDIAGVEKLKNPIDVLQRESEPITAKPMDTASLAPTVPLKTATVIVEKCSEKENRDPKHMLKLSDGANSGNSFEHISNCQIYNMVFAGGDIGEVGAKLMQRFEF